MQLFFSTVTIKWRQKQISLLCSEWLGISETQFTYHILISLMMKGVLKHSPFWRFTPHWNNASYKWLTEICVPGVYLNPYGRNQSFTCLNLVSPVESRLPWFICFKLKFVSSSTHQVQLYPCKIKSENTGGHWRQFFKRGHWGALESHLFKLSLHQIFTKFTKCWNASSKMWDLLAWDYVFQSPRFMQSMKQEVANLVSC